MMNWKQGDWWTLIFWPIWALPESMHKLMQRMTQYVLVRVRDEAHQTIGFFWEKRYRLGNNITSEIAFLKGDPNQQPIGIVKPE